MHLLQLHHIIQAAMGWTDAHLHDVAVAGVRACPPEDAGGSGGYQDFLDGLATDPRDEEVVSFLEWAGADFDPDRLDRRAANAALQRMAWNRRGEK